MEHFPSLNSGMLQPGFSAPGLVMLFRCQVTCNSAELELED